MPAAPFVINLVTSSSPRFSVVNSSAILSLDSAADETPRSSAEIAAQCNDFKSQWLSRLNNLFGNELGSNGAESDISTASAAVHKRRTSGSCKRRTSYSFKITPTTASRKVFRNRAEALQSIRLHMSQPMVEAYGEELRRRFTDRQMPACLPPDLSSVLVPSEAGSFRWSFGEGNELVPQQLFVLDTETLWNEFIVPGKYSELLDAYAAATTARTTTASTTYLYFMNWKRLLNKYTQQLNRQFQQSIRENHSFERPPTAADLENLFFLAAAERRIPVNFGAAVTAPQSLVDLVDFVVELSRVVAGKFVAGRQSNQHLVTHPLSVDSVFSDNNADCVASPSVVTISRDIKVKCGRDARDCWHRALCQIPRMTAVAADVVLSRYETFGALMRAYSLCPSISAAENLLSDLTLVVGGKRIGPVLSGRIYRHFCE